MSYLAEENIIGSLLLDKNCMDEIYNVLSADMFTSELLGRIYLEFQKGYDNRYEVNPAVIIQKIAGDQIPENIVIEELIVKILAENGEGMTCSQIAVECSKKLNSNFTPQRITPRLSALQKDLKVAKHTEKGASLYKVVT